MRQKNPVLILIADDDIDDRDMLRDALQESRLLNEVRFVQDGEELMAYLNRTGPYSDVKKYPTPGMILLDLNMPRKDGREALKEIKGSETLRQIPVIVLTTSKAEEDIFRSYNLGVNSFITKPVKFSSLVELMKSLGQYWFEIVELPRQGV